MTKCDSFSITGQDLSMEIIAIKQSQQKLSKDLMSAFAELREQLFEEIRKTIKEKDTRIIEDCTEFESLARIVTEKLPRLPLKRVEDLLEANEKLQDDNLLICMVMNLF